MLTTKQKVLRKFWYATMPVWLYTRASGCPLSAAA